MFHVVAGKEKREQVYPMGGNSSYISRYSWKLFTTFGAVHGRCSFFIEES
jgi:hypothetical protein